MEDRAGAIDGKQHNWGAEILGVHRDVSLRFFLHPTVMPFDATHHQNHRRNQHESDPSTFGEFRDQDYSYGDRGGDCAQPILGGLAARVGGARVTVGAIRVTFWGALAMAVTAGVGALFGTVA